jgi:uncharacterized coiled-coil DUF342 family protein
MVTHKSTINNHKIFALLLACALVLLCGCKDTRVKKAAQDAAQARAELVKAKADIVQLKGEASYLRERLKTTEQARDNLQQQLDDILTEHETATGDTQQEINNLRTAFVEQITRTLELQKQVDRLKAVIRELQTSIEQKSITKNQPPEQETEQLPPDSLSETNL